MTLLIVFAGGPVHTYSGAHAWTFSRGSTWTFRGLPIGDPA